MNRALAPFFLVLLLVGSTMAGCIGATRDFYGFRPGIEYRNPAVFPGNYSHVDQNGSYVLQRGFYPYGDAEIVRLRSPRSGSNVPGTVSENEGAVWITMAIWRPIDGFLDGPVPVLVDAGPFFEADDYCATPDFQCNARPLRINVPSRLTGFLLKNYLPHGYAVVQLAVRGTGTTGGCMELMGPNEAADLNLAVNWLGQQSWSNGNVSMIGFDYDASVAWMVAAGGNEHLRAIVPMGGVPDLFSWLFHNGTKDRAADLYYANLWGYGLGRSNVPAAIRNDPKVAPALNLSPVRPHANERTQAQDRHNILCPEVAEGVAMAQYSAANGDRGAQQSDFWIQRDFRKRVLQNYRGSVFLTPGLQDWNTEPSTLVPFNQQLREAGIDVREWHGQWGHTTPDRGVVAPGPLGCSKDIHRYVVNACRYDFAEVLLRYFDHHLKGNASREMGPAIQVQDNRGYWRIEDSYPAADATWTRLHPTVNGKLNPLVGAAEDVVLLPPPGDAVDMAGQAGRQKALHGPVHWLELKTEPFAEDTRISGLPRLHLQFEAEGPGGFLAAWAFDENEAGEVADRLVYCNQPACDPPRLPHPASILGSLPLIGHAQMDLRFHAGGEGRQTLSPGQRYTARMEFDPLDVLIPKGHRLTMWVLQYPYPDKTMSPAPSPVRLWLGGSASYLDLPIITVDARDVFTAPGSHFPLERDYPRYYVEKPDYEQLLAPIQPPVAKECSFAPSGNAC